MSIVIYNFSNAFGRTSIIWVIRTSFKRSLSEGTSIKGFPLMLLFFFEPIITKMLDKYFKKHPNSKSWLKKNYDLRMEIQNSSELIA